VNIFSQPETVSCCSPEIYRRLRLEGEAVDEKNNVGDVTDKACHIAELHKPVNLAYCTTERLVTSTKQHKLFHDSLDMLRRVHSRQTELQF